MELVCFQGFDKENWPQINALIKRGEWENIIIIKNNEVENFNVPKNCTILPINTSLPLMQLKEEIIKNLKPRISKDFEVALSLASGTGKEHMSLISALLSIPVGIRLVAYTKNGIEFIN